MWGLCGKRKLQYVLALIAMSAAIQKVTGGQNRINEGRIPPPGKYPSIARMVQTFPRGNNLTICVLSILTRDWLVTTALCVVGSQGLLPLENFTVVVGDEILNETEPYEREHKIERVIIHHRHDKFLAGYNKQVGDDIAVVKVKPPIMFSNRVSPANLPTCKVPVTPGTVLVAGYGTDIGLVPNHRLTEITGTVISNEECQRKFGQFGAQVDDRIFCINETDKQMIPFFGDTGAPVFLVKSDAYMVQVGMLMTWPAWGPYTTYINLTSYLGWIHRRISGCGNHIWYNVTNYDDY